MKSEALTEPMPDRIADNVRALRRARSWSQQQLADKVAGYGVPMNRQAIAKIECKDRRVLATELWALARVFLLDDPTELLMGQCSTCTGSPPPGLTCDRCGTGQS